MTNSDLVIMHLNMKASTIFIYDNSNHFYTIKCVEECFADFVKGSTTSDMPDVHKYSLQTPLIKTFINGVDLKMNYVYTENKKFRLVSGKTVFTFEPERKK